MIILIGASASGKTEIAKILTKQYNIKKCITTTTREIRVGEFDGIDYHFVSRDEFTKGLNKNEFIAVFKYQDNFYGLNKKDINKNSLIILDPSGANELIKYNGKDFFVVYIESNRDLRYERMINRGDNIGEIVKRLDNDDKIFVKNNILKIDLVLENNDQPIYECVEEVYNAYRGVFTNNKA